MAPLSALVGAAQRAEHHDQHQVGHLVQRRRLDQGKGVGRLAVPQAGGIPQYWTRRDWTEFLSK